MSQPAPKPSAATSAVPSPGTAGHAPAAEADQNSVAPMTEGGADLPTAEDWATPASPALGPYAGMDETGPHAGDADGPKSSGAAKQERR